MARKRSSKRARLSGPSDAGAGPSNSAAVVAARGTGDLVQLPPEILAHILELVGLTSAQHLRAVSKAVRDAVDSIAWSSPTFRITAERPETLDRLEARVRAGRLRATGVVLHIDGRFRNVQRQPQSALEAMASAARFELREATVRFVFRNAQCVRKHALAVLGALRAAGRLERLAIESAVDPEEMESASPLTDADLLPALRPLAALRALRLPESLVVKPAGAAAIAEALPGLESLALREAGLPAMAALGPMPRLRDLQLLAKLPEWEPADAEYNAMLGSLADSPAGRSLRLLVCSSKAMRIQQYWQNLILTVPRFAALEEMRIDGWLALADLTALTTLPRLRRLTVAFDQRYRNDLPFSLPSVLPGCAALEALDLDATLNFLSWGTDEATIVLHDLLSAGRAVLRRCRLRCRSPLRCGTALLLAACPRLERLDLDFLVGQPGPYESFAGRALPGGLRIGLRGPEGELEPAARRLREVLPRAEVCLPAPDGGPGS